MIQALDGIGAKHLLQLAALGLVAGIVAYAVDTYLIARVESAVGVTPGVL